MAILHVTLSHENLNSYSYQVCIFLSIKIITKRIYASNLFIPKVFRALANLMELTNYSITFYIYCLFSEDFRSTLFRTLKWPWIGNPICNQRKDEVNSEMNRKWTEMAKLNDSFFFELSFRCKRDQLSRRKSYLIKIITFITLPHLDCVRWADLAVFKMDFWIIHAAKYSFGLFEFVLPSVLLSADIFFCYSLY